MRCSSSIAERQRTSWRFLDWPRQGTLSDLERVLPRPREASWPLPGRTATSAVSNSRTAAATTRSSTHAVATFGNMATMATFATTTESMNQARITTVTRNRARSSRRPARNCPLRDGRYYLPSGGLYPGECGVPSGHCPGPHRHPVDPLESAVVTCTRGVACQPPTAPANVDQRATPRVRGLGRGVIRQYRYATPQAGRRPDAAAVREAPCN